MPQEADGRPDSDINDPECVFRKTRGVMKEETKKEGIVRSLLSGKEKADNEALIDMMMKIGLELMRLQPVS